MYCPHAGVHQYSKQFSHDLSISIGLIWNIVVTSRIIIQLLTNTSHRSDYHTARMILSRLALHVSWEGTNKEKQHLQYIKANHNPVEPPSLSQVSISTKTPTYKLPVNIALTDCFRWFSLILVTKLSHSPADPEPFVFERKIVKLLSKLEKSARSSWWVSCFVNEFSVDIFCPIFTV